MKLHSTQCTRIQSAVESELTVFAEFVHDDFAAFAGIADLLLTSSASSSDIYMVKDKNTMTNQKPSRIHSTLELSMSLTTTI